MQSETAQTQSLWDNPSGHRTLIKRIGVFTNSNLRSVSRGYSGKPN